MIHWITENLGTSSWDQAKCASDIQLLDVRDLVDQEGNKPAEIKARIDEALAWLQRSKKVVVCCDYGISRSNAIAVGILSLSDGISFDDAIRRVMSTTLQTGIRIETLNSVRRAVELFRPETAVSLMKSEMKILVTGASGYLGRPLTRSLSSDFALEVPTRGEVNLLESPLNLDIMVKEKKITHILHAANPRDIGRNQAQSLGQAIVMLKNILDVCKGNDIKLINLSSWEVYSAYRSDRLLAAESLPPYPKRSPGETKFLSEILIEHYRSLHGIAYVNLRTTLVYGGEYTRPNFIFNFLQKAARSEKIIVHKYINGYPIIDLIHISDFCRAVQTILNNNVSGTFNIGSGRGYTSRNIAEMIKTTMGSKSPVEFIEIDDYAPNIVLDPKKMISLGWRPQIDLHSGIENLAVRYCGKEA